ncbi:hypothetical protein BDV06DRAFT_225331 [Aspergillus oleicola]
MEEHHLTCNPNQRNEDEACERRVKVAFRSDGLTGIKFCFDNGSSSSWLGDAIGQGICHGLLKVPEHYGQYALVAGFDRFKILTLGFGGLTGSLRSPNSRLARDRLQSPMTNIDFGGPDGQLLAYLERIVIYLHGKHDINESRSDSSPLQGLEVCYAGGSRRFWGKAKGCGLSFLINGAAGERINKVEILFGKEGSVMGGLRISTNHGRSNTFETLEDRLRATAAPMPDIPNGHVITGLFTAPFAAANSHFDRVGIQALPLPSSNQALRPASREDSQNYVVPDSQLRYAHTRHANQGPRRGGIADRTYITYAPVKM